MISESLFGQEQTDLPMLPDLRYNHVIRKRDFLAIKSPLTEHLQSILSQVYLERKTGLIAWFLRHYTILNFQENRATTRQ